jgi:hypothetical protein
LGEYVKELSTSGLRGSRQHLHDGDCPQQRLGNGWLNDQVGDVAKGAVGLNCLAVRVHMPGLHDAAEGNECTAEKAEHYPQAMACT